MSGCDFIDEAGFRKDGSRFLGDTTSAIFRDEAGAECTTTLIRDITEFREVEAELKKLNEKISRFANYDFLTNLINRRAFLDRMAQEMERVKRENNQMSLVLMDIDYFKQINDQYGHLTGDYILKEIAQVLIGCIRPYDILGRFGGDEFILCLPDTTFGEAVHIAERIRQTIEETEMKLNNMLIQVTASLGVTSYLPISNETVDSIISQADNCMYRAKTKRNFVYSI